MTYFSMRCRDADEAKVCSAAAEKKSNEIRVHQYHFACFFQSCGIAAILCFCPYHPLTEHWIF